MSRLLNRFSLLTVAAIVCLASSATAGTILDGVDDGRYLALGNSSLYDSVGQFTGSTFSASGVLIASNWVLTAGHVVSDTTSLTFNIGGGTYIGKSWISHPKWGGDVLKGYDIGLVQLTDDVTGIMPAERYEGNDELDKVGTSVGFGRTGTGLTGDVVYDGKKRAGQNDIDVWLRTPGRTPRVFMSDFDNPAGTENAWGRSSSTPLDLEYLIAPGDSGGGVFANFGGSELLIGIHSFGAAYDGTIDSDYGDISGHTRVSVFNKWIDQILRGTDDGGGGNGGGKPGNGGGGGGGNGNGKGGGKPTSEFVVSLAGLASVPVPEPSTLAMLTLCGLCLVGRWWRKRQA